LKAILVRAVPSCDDDYTKLYCEVYHIEQNQDEKLIFTNRFGD